MTTEFDDATAKAALTVMTRTGMTATTVPGSRGWRISKHRLPSELLPLWIDHACPLACVVDTERAIAKRSPGWLAALAASRPSVRIPTYDPKTARAAYELMCGRRWYASEIKPGEWKLSGELFRRGVIRGAYRGLLRPDVFSDADISADPFAVLVAADKAFRQLVNAEPTEKIFAQMADLTREIFVDKKNDSITLTVFGIGQLTLSRQSAETLTKTIADALANAEAKPT